MRWRIPILLWGSIGVSLVAGCKKTEAPQPENRAIEHAPPAPTPPVAEPEPVVPKVVVPKPKPAPEPSAEQQVIDDADATGMTAHVSRNTYDDTSSLSTNSDD